MENQSMLRTLLLFCVMSLAQASDAVRDAGEHFFQETFGDFREELELAREEGKQGILLFFEQEDCPFCHRMKTTVLNQATVQDYFREHFRIFSVDIEGDLEVTDFNGDHTTQKDFAFRQFGVRATPVFAFFDLDGRLVARHTGPTGNAREFLWLGEYVADGHYRDQTFTVYKRERRRQNEDG
jgi:thioredoxin-related protein